MRQNRFIVVLLALVSALWLGTAVVSAQTLAQQPQTQMRSTSTLAPVGSTLPQAAATGTYTTYSAAPGKGGLRRDVGGGGTTEDETEPTVPTEPFPLGDGLLPLLIMALGFIGIIYLRRRRVEE